MATAAQAQEIIDELDEKVARLREAVQALTNTSSAPESSEANPTAAPADQKETGTKR